MAEQMQIECYSALPPGEKGDLLHSVQRALRVLSLVAEHPQGLSARDISGILSLNISTCYHILNTLVTNGYLDRRPQRQVYLLGPQIPFLNNAFVLGLTSQEPFSPTDDEMESSIFSAASLVERLRS